MSEKSNKWWVLIAMCLLTAIVNIDVAGLNVAIPTIAQEFHANLPSMQWVINIYVLMSASFQILGGRLGDAFGHKKLYLIGCAAFVLGSLGAGFAINEATLIFFRTIQGISLGIAFPISVVLILEAFPKKQQSFAISFMVTTMGVCLALGPILGGLFVHYLTWRWIFYINIPIGLISLFLASIYCKSHEEVEKKNIDYFGALLLVLGLVAIIIPLNQLQVWGFNSLKFWLFFVGGCLVLFTLYLTSRNKSDPIFEFKLFKIRNFSLNTLIRFTAQLTFIPVLFFIPLYLQNIVGMTAFNSGIMMLLLTVAIVIASPFVGKWVDKVGDRTPNLLAMSLYATGCFLFLFVNVNVNYPLFIIALALIGFGTAITFVSTVTGSMSQCEPKDHGIASGVFFTIAWLSCAVGVAVMGSILAMSGDGYLSGQLKDLSVTLTSKQAHMAQSVASGVTSFKDLSSHFSSKMLTNIIELTRKSFVHGFKVAMFSFMFIALAGLVLSLFLKRIKPSHPSEDIHPPI